MTGDELLPVVLLVERRFELGLDTSLVDTHDESEVGAGLGDSSGSWTTVTKNVSLRRITSESTVTLKNLFEMTRWTC